MNKGRAKITTNSEGSAPPRPRSLRSRKRECPDDKTTLSDNAQPTLPPQDTEGNVATAAATPPPQCPTPQSPLQECSKSLTQEEQAEEESFPATQKSDTEDKYLVAPSICAEHVMDKAVEGAVQGETLLTNPNDDSQLKDDSQGGEEQEEEVKTQESNRSPSHTPEDQLRSTVPTSQEGDMGEEGDQKEPNGVCMGDDKKREITKEAVVGLPAKKKRRMGMCGLTEKERSNILQAQKRENGKNGTGGGERKSGNTMSDVVVIPSMSLSSSPLPIPATEQSDSEIKLQSGYCGREDRTEAVVHVATTTSEVTNNVCNPFGQDPGCSEEETCQANPSVEPGPGQINDPGMDPAAEREGHRDNRSLIQEVERSADVETTVEQYEKQRKEEEDGPGESDYHPTTDICENVGAEGDQIPRDGRLEEMEGEAGGGAVADTGASSIDAGPQVCSYEEIRKAAVTPSGSEENGNCVIQYEKQSREEEDGPGESDYHPTTDKSENVGAEGDQTRTRDGRLEEMGGEAGGGAVADTGASSTDAGPQVCSYEEIRKATVTPSGSEENGNCVIQYEKQRREEEDGPGESDYHPTTDISENVGAEGDQTRTRDGRLEEMGGEAGGGAVADPGASSTDAGPQVCSYEEIRKAAVTPSGSEENGNCVPDDNPDTGPSPVSTEHPQTSETTDPFGFGPLDYVTDSQLNSMFLIEEEAAAMEADAGPGSRQEDATDLVCGLIRELSILNRTVMAAHRELEHLRRGSKASRASIRRGSGPAH